MQSLQQWAFRVTVHHASLCRNRNGCASCAIDYARALARAMSNMAHHSVQLELAANGLDLRRSNQSRVGDADRMQRSFKFVFPELQEPLELGEARVKIVVLPHIALQEPRVIRPPVENVRCR